MKDVSRGYTNFVCSIEGTWANSKKDLNNFLEPQIYSRVDNTIRFSDSSIPLHQHNKGKRLRPENMGYR